MAGTLQKDDSQIGWFEDGDWVWRLSFDAAEVAVPSITHLRIPGGVPLLRAPGGQFSWPRINGVEYPLLDDAAADAVTWRVVGFETLPDGGAVVRQRIDYHHPSGRREMSEYRDLVFSAVGRNGKYTVDWTSHFTAGEAGAVLEDSSTRRAGLRLPLDGGVEAADFREIPPIGQYEEVGLLPDGLRHAAGLGTFLNPSARHPGSIGIVADPRSTIGPHAWQIDGERREMVAALLGGQTRRLEPGEVWELSYRIVVRPKQWDATDLRLELFRWLQR